MIKQSVQESKKYFGGSIGLVTIMKAIIVSYIITIVAFNMFAFILSYTDFPEKYILPSVVATTIISILFASSTVTKSAKSKGWLNGAAIGLVYMLFLYFISSLVFNNFKVDKYVGTMFAIGILTGAIGGILGINIKTGSRIKYKR